MRECLCLICLLLTALVTRCQQSLADGARPADAPVQNIALGRPYTFNKPPDYRYCTTGTESTKLTDGIYTKGYFWTRPTTTGWAGARQVIINVDLGRDEPISGVSLNTAAGAGDAIWPAAIDILTSDDGQQYYYLGELLDMDQWRRQSPLPDNVGYKVHRFWTDDLKVHGRYVVFAISSPNFTFVDEIEIYRGSPEFQHAPLPGVAYAGPEAFLTRTAVQRGVARRISRDAFSLLLQAGQASRTSAAVSADTLRNMHLAASSPDQLQHDYGKDFRAILPLTPMHRDLYRIAAEQLRAAGIATPQAVAADRWASLSHLGLSRSEDSSLFNVLVMQNEYRGGAINIINPLNRDLELRLQFAGLPGGATPPYVKVSEVEFTDTWGGEVVAQALSEATRDGDAWIIHIPSGMTRQVWMTFHPTDVKAGSYTGQVRLRDGDTSLTVPLGIRVASLRFPDQPSLGLGGWDYTDLESGNAVTAANREQIIACLREYFVDSPWATRQVLSEGKHDPASGTMIAPPDTHRFDAWVRSWPQARRYCVFVNAPDTFQGFATDRPQFAVAVQQWIQFWSDHARQLGTRPENLYLLLVDEPRTPVADKLAIAWAQAIRAGHCGVTVWEDPVHQDPATAEQDLFTLCHVLCPNRQILKFNESYRRFFNRTRSTPWRTELYSASGPARLMDAYAYYRLPAWECWRRNAGAEYFWSFCDDGSASSWNEYASSRQAYTPLFIDPTSVTPSKQMEAIREGIEDYEYLAMLRRRLGELEAQGRVTLRALEAKDLLETVAGKVLGADGADEIYWFTRRDRFTADRARSQMLDMLIALE